MPHESEEFVTVALYATPVSKYRTLPVAADQYHVVQNPPIAARFVQSAASSFSVGVLHPDPSPSHVAIAFIWLTVVAESDESVTMVFPPTEPTHSAGRHFTVPAAAPGVWHADGAFAVTLAAAESTSAHVELGSAGFRMSPDTDQLMPVGKSPATIASFVAGDIAAVWTNDTILRLFWEDCDTEAAPTEIPP